MVDFAQTGYGRRFFDSDLPRLLDALESIARSLALQVERAQRHDGDGATIPLPGRRTAPTATPPATTDESNR